MIDEVKNILDKRKKLNNEDDYNIERCRELLIEELSKNENDTIFILNQLQQDDIMLVSEVFEEIAYNLQSVNYIKCLKKIADKYTELDLADCIEVAEEYMD